MDALEDASAVLAMIVLKATSARPASLAHFVPEVRLRPLGAMMWPAAAGNNLKLARPSTTAQTESNPASTHFAGIAAGVGVTSFLVPYVLSRLGAVKELLGQPSRC